MKTSKLPKGARTQGFTLIELLVVISIIAILAGFAMPVFTSAQKKGRITDSVSNCKQTVLALRMYADDNDGLYPSTTAPVGGVDGTALAAGDYSNKAFENLMPKYTTSKKIFINKASAWCKNPIADTTAADSNLVKKGQNDWLYILGLTSTSDSRWPLIATGTKSASELTYTNITSDKGGVWGGTDAVIGYCDGSVRPAGAKDMNNSTVTATFVKSPLDGTSNILTATAEWLGTSAVVLAPE
ncbi:MAG: type II secretion system protein [Chthoniobacteraceae bacterium]